MDIVIAGNRGLVADHQQLAAGPGVDIQRAENPVEVAGQEVGSRDGGERLIREGSYVDPVVPAVGVDVGNGARAADIENVGTRTQVEVQRIDTVIVHPGRARRDGDGCDKVPVVNARERGGNAVEIDRVGSAGKGNRRGARAEDAAQNRLHPGGRDIPCQRRSLQRRTGEVEAEGAADGVDRKSRRSGGRARCHGEGERHTALAGQQTLEQHFVGRAVLRNNDVLETIPARLAAQFTSAGRKARVKRIENFRAHGINAVADRDRESRSGCAAADGHDKAASGRWKRNGLQPVEH